MGSTGPVLRMRVHRTLLFGLLLLTLGFTGYSLVHAESEDPVADAFRSIERTPPPIAPATQVTGAVTRNTTDSSKVDPSVRRTEPDISSN